jgi:hypothetical protein
VIASIRDKCQVSRSRLLDTGNPGNFDVANSALQSALQPFSDVAQLQNNSRGSRLKI